MEIFFTPSPNFKKNKNNPKFIVVHYTAGGTVDGAIEMFKKPNSVSCHYIIGKKGDITQMVKEEDIAYHAGRSTYEGIQGKSLNPYSIGIELVNWGLLYRDNSHILRRWTGSQHYGKYMYVNNTYWDYYPFVQMTALVELIKDIRKRHPGIKIVGHSDISPGRKVDPSPALDWDRLFIEVDPTWE